MMMMKNDDVSGVVERRWWCFCVLIFPGSQVTVYHINANNKKNQQLKNIN